MRNKTRWMLKSIENIMPRLNAMKSEIPRAIFQHARTLKQATLFVWKQVLGSDPRFLEKIFHCSFYATIFLGNALKLEEKLRHNYNSVKAAIKSKLNRVGDSKFWYKSDLKNIFIPRTLMSAWKMYKHLFNVEFTGISMSKCAF